MYGEGGMVLVVGGEVVMERLHDLSAGVSVEAGLVIVAIGGMAAHAEVLPRPGVYLVFQGP